MALHAGRADRTAHLASSLRRARRAPLEQLDPFIFGHPEWSTLVFVDGAYSDALSRVPVLPPA